MSDSKNIKKYVINDLFEENLRKCLAGTDKVREEAVIGVNINDAKPGHILVSDENGNPKFVEGSWPIPESEYNPV